MLGVLQMNHPNEVLYNMLINFSVYCHFENFDSAFYQVTVILTQKKALGGSNVG